MKPIRMVGTLASLTIAAVVASGCLQVVKLVDIDLGNLSAVSGAASAGQYVDLAADNSTYADNKDKFQDIADLAVLGTFKNNLSTGGTADVWMVAAPSSPALLGSLGAVQGAGGVKIWSITLGPNETKTLTWDNSAAAFIKPDGKKAMEDELSGDAIFTLYVFGSTSTYNVTVTGGIVAVMVGADIGL